MSIGRREMLFGAGCVAVLGLGEFLRPRDTLRLLANGTKLTTILPTRVGGWAAGEGGDIVLPDTPGSLADRLYNDRVARTYQRGGDLGSPIMLLAAYGAAQNDLLQLHRPEACYPAIGMGIVAREVTMLPLAPGVALPIVRLTAHASGRTEDIVYWTRLGDALPQTAGDQREARFAAALKGYTADGILVRASAIREAADGEPQFGELMAFVRAFILDTRPAARAALVGRPISDALAKVRPAAV